MKITMNNGKPFIETNKEENKVICDLDITIHKICLAMEGDCKKCPFYSFNDCSYPSFALSLCDVSKIFE